MLCKRNCLEFLLFRDCLDLHFQSNIIEKCSCYNTGIYGLNYSKPCLTSDDYVCITFVNSQRDKLNQNCTQCPLECNSVKYELSTSFGEYPGKEYANNLVKNTVLNTILSNYSYEELKEKILAVNFYYSELRYTEITQTEQTSIMDLVCGIGGLLGLFVGASLLSLVELIEAFLALYLVLTKKN